MPEFKVVYFGDGTTVAESIAKKFTEDKYNFTVELHDLRRRSSISSLQSSSSSASPSPTTDVIADISVLLVTPRMMEYLGGVIEDDRSQLINLMKSVQPAVALSCYVSVLRMKETIEATFNDDELFWRYLEFGEAGKSFRQCMIELMAMLEEGREEMPVPTLKKYHLLPDNPVLAQDTVYILVEKHLVDYNLVQSLSVVFKDGHQVTANRIADCLYQFEVPDSSESSKAIEVFSSGGESLGTDNIRYRDKLQVFAEVLNDVLNSAIVQGQSSHTFEDVNESIIADWFTSEKLSTEGDIQKLLAQWMKTDKTDANSGIPLLVYLCAKCNLRTVAQSLLRDPRSLDKVNSLCKDESSEEDQEVEYENHRSCNGLEADDEDDAYYSSVTIEDYVCPEDVVETRYHDDYENFPERKTSTVSAFIPRTMEHNVEREPLSKSCPPVCGKHGCMSADKGKKCYANIPVCAGLKAEASRYTFHDCPVSKDLTEPQHEASERKVGLSEIQAPYATRVNERPSGDRPMLPESLSDDIRPDLPPKRRTNKSKQHALSSSQSLCRLGLASLKQGSTPPYYSMNSSTLSLTKLYDSKPSFNGQPMVDSSARVLPGKSLSIRSSSTLSLPRLCGQIRTEYSTRYPPTPSPDADAYGFNKFPPVPYLCRPSPPIPHTGPHRKEHSHLASDGLSVRGHTAGRQQRKSETQEACCSPENLSDDSPPGYSQPIELYFQDGQTKGFFRSDSFSEQEDKIYENIDETSENEASTDTEAIYNVPRYGIHRAVFADVVPASPRSSVPTSPVSPEPPSPKKSSSRSSPWSSFKQSLRMPGKSKRHNTKL